jgi:hypothetical protein
MLIKKIFTLCCLLLHMTCGVAAGQDEAAASLSLRIVPDSLNGDGKLIHSARMFSVVLTNIGKGPVRLWRESCSWGYDNLSFEIKNADGAATRLRKRPRVWEKNFPDWAALAPGSRMVFEVLLDASTWINVPLSKVGSSRTLQLQAIYESTEDKDSRASRVWVGRVASPAGVDIFVD